VAGCTELAVLERWILRARTARDRAEVFAAG